jgi:hypothetical protein
MTTLSPSGKKVRLGKNMRASIEYAARTPDRWHDIGKGRGAKMAIRRLAKAGLVEVKPECPANAVNQTLARLAFFAALRRIQNQNSQATPPVNNVAPSPLRPSATPDSSRSIAAAINAALRI